jgi:hypothetical protein
MSIDANGNVGIGTASPGSLLTIESTSGNQLRLNYNADWYNIIERDSAGDLNFLEKRGASASLVNLMTIKTGGNVGIGTASPSGDLHVHGENIYFSSKLVSNCTWRIMPQTGNSTKKFRIYDNDNSADRFVIDSSGHVIIGDTGVTYDPATMPTSLTATPSAPILHVNGTIQLKNNSDAIVIGHNNATFLKDEELHFGWGGGWYMNDNTNLRVVNNKKIYTSGGAYIGGNVGIGTVNPNVRLHVHGGHIGFVYGNAIKIATSNGSFTTWATNNTGTHTLLEPNWSSNTGAGDVVRFYTPGSQNASMRMILTSAGNVGINTETMIDSRNYGGIHLANSKGVSFAASTNSNSRHWRIRTDDYSDHGSLQFGVSDSNSSGPDAHDEVVMTMDRNRRIGLGAGAVYPKANLQIGDYIPNNTGTNNTIPSSNMGHSASFPATTKIWMANRASSTEEDYWGCAMGVIWNGHSYFQSINKKTSSVYALLLQPNGGNVGIGYTSSSYKLSINGSLYYTSGGLNGSDDRIKYNEQNVSNALALISQLKPQKYEKIMEFPNNTGTWIPTDEEWENVKADYKYGDEFGFIAQDVREIPELSFLVNGEETRMDTETVSQEEYSNLATEEQITFTQSYTYESNTITQEEYSDLAPVDREMYTPQYTKQTETETPLALNYQGLFVVAIGAIQELAVKNDALEAQLQAEKTKTATLETQVAALLTRVTALENA